MRSGITDELQRAGVSRSTYYYRRNQGLTHEQALIPEPRPRAPREVASVKMPEAAYERACAALLAEGLMRPNELHSREIVLRRKRPGVPTKLAVLAVDRLAAGERAVLAQEAGERFADLESVREWLADPIVQATLVVLYRNATSLTSSQIANTMLFLARRGQSNKATT